MSDSSPTPTCPACEAPLPPSSGTPLVTCPACGSALPKLVLRKENKALLAAGLILSLLGWVGLTTSAAAFIGDTPALIIFSALCLPLGLVGLILLALGFTAKGSWEEALAAFDEHMRAKGAWLEEQPTEDVDWIAAHERAEQYWHMQQVSALARSHQRRRRLRLWGIALAAISVELLIFSFVLLWASGSEVLLMVLPLTLVPGMLGLFLIMMGAAVRRRDASNLDALRAYEAQLATQRGE